MRALCSRDCTYSPGTSHTASGSGREVTNVGGSRRTFCSFYKMLGRCLMCPFKGQWEKFLPGCRPQKQPASLLRSSVMAVAPASLVRGACKDRERAPLRLMPLHKLVTSWRAQRCHSENTKVHVKRKEGC